MLLASLPWYDLSEITPSTDALWRQLAWNLTRAGVANVPTTLNRQVPYEQQWSSSRFLFGQACGYDACITHTSSLRLVATPRYAAPGCSGSGYRSFVVVRDNSECHDLEELRSRHCVINTATSHSGMNSWRALVADRHCNGRFFGEVQISGSHKDSLSMIRCG